MEGGSRQEEGGEEKKKKGESGGSVSTDVGNRITCDSNDFNGAKEKWQITEKIKWRIKGRKRSSYSSPSHPENTLCHNSAHDVTFFCSVIAHLDIDLL